MVITLRLRLSLTLFPSQKKRLCITQSFGLEHSDLTERLTDSTSLAAPAVEKDRSSTPGSSGGEEKQFVVGKVREISSCLGSH